MSRAMRWYWLAVQVAAVAGGIYAGREIYAMIAG